MGSEWQFSKVTVFQAVKGLRKVKWTPPKIWFLLRLMTPHVRRTRTGLLHIIGASGELWGSLSSRSEPTRETKRWTGLGCLWRLQDTAGVGGFPGCTGKKRGRPGRNLTCAGGPSHQLDQMWGTRGGSGWGLKPSAVRHQKMESQTPPPIHQYTLDHYQHADNPCVRIENTGKETERNSIPQTFIVNSEAWVCIHSFQSWLLLKPS